VHSAAQGPRESGRSACRCGSNQAQEQAGEHHRHQRSCNRGPRHPYIAARRDRCRRRL